MVTLVKDKIYVTYKGRNLVFDKKYLDYMIKPKDLPLDLQSEAKEIDNQIQAFVDKIPILTKS